MFQFNYSFTMEGLPLTVLAPCYRRIYTEGQFRSYFEKLFTRGGSGPHTIQIKFANIGARFECTTDSSDKFNQLFEQFIRDASRAGMAARSAGVLTDTQQAILEASEPGEVLIVYRTDVKHPRGCSFLANYLYTRCGWERGPSHHFETRERVLDSGKDVVFDCEHGLVETNLFRALRATDQQRVIVFYFGTPPPTVHATLDITHSEQVPQELYK